MGRTFNNIEEALEVWEAEREEANKKIPRIGILCKCSCYRWPKDEKSPRPIRSCTLILPKARYEQMYKNYEWNVKMQIHTPKSQITFLDPGTIKVILDEREQENYWLKHELCEYQYIFRYLLSKHLGKKIQLGKNILV